MRRNASGTKHETETGDASKPKNAARGSGRRGVRKAAAGAEASTAKTPARPSASASGTKSATSKVVARARAKRTPAQRPKLISRLAAVDGARVHAVERVVGPLSDPGVPTPPAVVLIHGAGLDHRDWTFRFMDQLGTALDRRRGPSPRLIAVDRPGFGRSDRPTGLAAARPVDQARRINAAVAAWGVERAILVGHSWGGAVAMAWAVARTGPPDAPDALREGPAVHGVASFAGAILPWSLAQTWKNAARMQEAARVALFAGGFNARGLGAAATAALADAFRPAPIPEGYLDHVETRLSATDGPTAATMADVSAINGALSAQAPRLAALRTPIELVYGVEDDVLDYADQAEKGMDALATARLTRLEGVGHMVHHSAPDRCVAAILRLIDIKIP